MRLISSKEMKRQIAARVEERAALAVHENMLAAFPAFTPYSAGSTEALAALTSLSITQTLPLLAKLAAYRKNGAVLERLPVEAFAKTQKQQEASAELARLFNRYGSDKADTQHRYHCLYGAILEDPASVKAIAEIGLGTNDETKVSHMGKEGKPGASLRAFRDYAPKASIFGADIDRNILFQEERVQTCFVDQTNPASFAELEALLPGLCDLLIDDGLHAPNANLATLLFGLQQVREGGWIVIEDIRREALPVWETTAALLGKDCASYLLEVPCGFVFAVRKAS
jgi:hypothetical protein